MAFDRHEEKQDQNSSHNTAGGHKEQPMEMSVTGKSSLWKRTKRGKEVEMERERERVRARERENEKERLRDRLRADKI